MLGFTDIKSLINFGKLISNLKSFNFSLYGRYMGYINVLLCFALGISNLFHVNLVIIFAIIAIIQGLILIFVELPFLLKICPLSDNFVQFIRRWETNGARVIFYAIMAIIQYCSCIFKVTSLLAVAIGLTFSSCSYGVAMIKHQDFAKASPESVIKNPIQDDDAFDIESGIDTSRQML
ncbi:Golgi apparatus membrane protein tvp18 [Hanseniaspora osmophila]|uniref:Golgi apparatus membrane protein TVP18 n=1 Tax=Hanseniaspora osmophila TaxID=56408 RepID=A0A1E5R5A1_9ASCO|nr:Golgi apparatus membrane protein TVP18 [Hanseniaspora osmophila]